MTQNILCIFAFNFVVIYVLSAGEILEVVYNRYSCLFRGEMLCWQERNLLFKSHRTGEEQVSSKMSLIFESTVCVLIFILNISMAY